MPTPLSQQLLLPLSTKQQRVELVEFAIEHNMNMITGNTLLNNNLWVSEFSIGEKEEIKKNI